MFAHRLIRKKYLSLVMTIACCVAPLAGGAAQRPPQRIVSLNLCTDQILMMLVEPSRIASVTHFSRNPALSVMAEKAVQLPINYGKAEEIFLQRPDLVLAGSYTSRTVLNLLRKLKQHIVIVPPANGFAAIYKNIEMIGAAVGEKARAAKLIDEMKAGLAVIEDNQDGDDYSLPVAALYFANGYSSGRETLVDAVVKKSGFRTLGQKLDFKGTRKISLEALVLARPDILVVGEKSYQGEAMAYEIFKHPALRHLMKNTATTSLANALTICGTPQTLQAIKGLRRLYERQFNWRGKTSK